MSLVQSATAFVAGTTLSPAFPGNVAAGDAIVVLVFQSAAISESPPAVSDNQGNTYAQIDTANINANEQLCAFIAPNCAAGSTTVTVTWANSGGSFAVILEYSGVAAASPVDAHSSGAAGPNATLDVQTTGSTDTLIAVCVGSGANLSGSISPSAGWTQEIAFGTTTMVCVWDRAVYPGYFGETIGIHNVNSAGVAAILIALFGGTPGPLTISPAPVFVELPDDTFDAGNQITDVVAKELNEDIKFAAVRYETFWGCYRNGETVVLPVSPADGYVYSRAELLYSHSFYWTGAATGALNGTQTRPPRGATSGAGNMLQFGADVSQLSGVVSTYVSYYASSETDTNDGILLVITHALRMR